MVQIEIIIYENDVPIGKWVGICERPDKVRAVIADTDTTSTVADQSIVNLARRSGIYTEPRPHMRRHQILLDRHSEVSLYIHARQNDCSDLEILAKSINQIWWDWYDAKLRDDEFKGHVERIERQARLTYATWMMNRFAAYKSPGRDARYTLQLAVAAYRAKRMRQSTFDNKIETSRERLRLMEGKDDKTV